MSAAEEHRTAYEVLGVPRDATAEEVRRAYPRRPGPPTPTSVATPPPSGP
ncbi:hypothetical protein AU359_00270 [Micrococcus luteus]|nr:J domain-containing protein [Micrococcus luteus]KWW42898.1 hypothetical protein AU359_00270 [Micrococcus luteus]